MAYSSDITQHPNFNTFIKLNKFYLSCIIQDAQGGLINDPQAAKTFARLLAIAYNTTGMMPTVDNSIADTSTGDSLTVKFTGYGIFGQEVLVTIGGELE